MKKILAPIALLLVAQCVYAGDDVIPFSSGGGVGVLRGGGNLYRPIPRAGTGIELTSAQRSRAVVFRPTQYFYMKDKLVSYRYSSQNLGHLRDDNGGTYFGPRGAQFLPGEFQPMADVSVRSFATTTKRPMPGVPMVPVSAKKSSRTASVEATSSIQLASAK